MYCAGVVWKEVVCVHAGAMETFLRAVDDIRSRARHSAHTESDMVLRTHVLLTRSKPEGSYDDIWRVEMFKFVAPMALTTAHA